MVENQKGEVVKVQRGGRITIPKALLQKKGIQEGDWILLSVTKAKVVADEEEKEE